MNKEYSWPIEPKYKVTEHDKYGIRKTTMYFLKKEHIQGLILQQIQEQKYTQLQLVKYYLPSLMGQQQKEQMHLMMATEIKQRF